MRSALLILQASCIRFWSFVKCFRISSSVSDRIATTRPSRVSGDKLSFAEMVDFLKLKRFGSLVDDEMDQQVFIMDLSFNPEITDELLVIYFDLNKDIFCITHES